MTSEYDNLKEWSTFLKHRGNTDDISYLIYKTDITEVESIIAAIKKNQSLDNFQLEYNNVVKYLIKTKSLETLTYLLYAKQCEPNAVGIKNYWGEMQRDTVEMKVLIEKGLNEYSNYTNDFLKTRCAYQIIRLTHYLKHYKETVKLYDSLITPLNSKSIIKYWALSHKAGALASLGEYTKSTYLFSRIFDECLSKRILAAQNFYIRSASQLYETLELCQNNHERTIVWFLHSYYTDDLGGLRKIYEMEPSSPYLEVLLTRLIENLETDIYRYWNTMLEPSWSNDYTRLDRDPFYNFIKTCAENRNTKRPYFWYYCAGYISLLRHDYKSMRENFQTSISLLPAEEKDFVERMKIIEIYSKVDEAKEINWMFESKIVTDLKWLLSLEKRHADEAFRWAILKLADKYLAQKDTAKYLVCRGQKMSKARYNNTVADIDFKSDPSSIPIEKVDSYLWASINKPEYDTFLKNNFLYTSKEIVEIKGTLLLSNYNFRGAILALERIKNGLDFLPADPFMMNLKDCQNCDAKELKTKLYTKYTFAIKMDSLEKQIKFNNKNLAENYFFLANAYYNISYFGNSWMITDFYRSRLETNYSPNNLDWSRAESYYLKAMTLSVDKEFQAKCTFMAAKCEQNKFYLDKGYLLYDGKFYSYNCERNPKIKKENYRTYFKTLIDKYSNTQFFNEAIKECKYFNNFVTNYAK